MTEQLLFEDFPRPQERLAAMTEEEKAAYILGLCCYDVETGEGKRVFTLRAARKYELPKLKLILDYLLDSGKIGYGASEKDCISFRNIMKAMEEQTPPPTAEELERAAELWEEIKAKYPVREEEEEEQC